MNPPTFPPQRPPRLSRAIHRVLWGGWGAVWLLSSSARADEKVIQEADKVVVRKKTVIDFTDVAVEGDLTKPEGSYVLNKKQAQFRSLIKVRDNFQPELQKSVDDL